MQQHLKATEECQQTFDWKPIGQKAISSHMVKDLGPLTKNYSKDHLTKQLSLSIV